MMRMTTWKRRVGAKAAAGGTGAARRAGLAIALGMLCWLATGVAAAEDTPIGVPEPDAELDDGTIAVRLIGREASQPIAGESVSLLGPGDTALTARTSASGWARFPNLSPGAQYMARVEVDDTVLESVPITLPEQGGVRITLSAEHEGRPPQHQPAAAPGAGQQGMPDPRQMSGVPRGERGDPPGQLIVRAVQGAFSPTESDAPEGAIIHLVSYGVDGSLTYDARAVDEDGRVIFENLEVDRSRAYYVVAVFERGELQDRLVSHPIMMPQTNGVRVMLAGPAADSNERVVDDVLEHTGAASAPLPPGQVVARLIGQVGQVREVELIEVGNPDQPLRSPATPPSPIPSDVHGELSSPQPDDALRDGVVVVSVRGQGEPLPGARVRVTPADGGEAFELRTPNTGQVRFEDLAAGERYVLMASVHGREFTSRPFEVPAQGGLSFQLSSTWQVAGMIEARFHDVPHGGDKVYAAQVHTDDGVFRSMPFVLTRERGAAVGVVVFSDLLLRFHLLAELDDERLWFDAQFGLRNPTTAPMMPKGERMTIPLPKGFASASVHDDFQHRVRTGSEGFLWRGPVAPGREVFRGQFSLPIRNGAFEFDMALPHGAWDSQIILEKYPGMTLRLPAVQGMQEETRPLGGREFSLLSNINIEHGTRLVIGGDGLPQRSVLERYLRYAAGIVTVGLLAWGFGGLFRRRGQGEGETEARKVALERQRERLLDDLAELERQHAKGEVPEARYQRSRENLRIELESVYTELRSGGEQKAS
jgi:hypothetical protein